MTSVQWSLFKCELEFQVNFSKNMAYMAEILGGGGGGGGGRNSGRSYSLT